MHKGTVQLNGYPPWWPCTTTRYPRTLGHHFPHAIILCAILIPLAVILIAALPASEMGKWVAAAIAATMTVLIATQWHAPRTTRRPGAHTRDPLAHLDEALGKAGLAIVSVDGRGRIRRFGIGAQALFGYTAAEMLGQPLAALLSEAFPDEHRHGRLPTDSLGAVAGSKGSMIALVTHKSGARLLIESQSAWYGHECILLFRDVSERQRTHDQLRLSAKVFENSLEGIVITAAEGQILSVNQTFTELTGWRLEEIIGRPVWELSRRPYEPQLYSQLLATLRATGRWEGEIWEERRNGEILAARVKIRALNDEHGAITNYIVSFADITAAKFSEEKLRYLTHHDPLTALPNRLAFQERLQLDMHAAREKGRMLAVLFLDLDRFKLVNDSLEHAVGDELLKSVGKRLRHAMRSDDVVARLGGDEFAVISTGLLGENDAVIVARKLLEALSEPFRVANHELHISASVGASLYPTDGNDVQTLMKNADTALFRAKEAGRNTYRFYQSTMNAASFEQLVLVNSMRRAVEREEFEVYYQPKLDLHTAALIGVEALVRWNNPDLGLVLPGQFIPLAEETGLIVPIGERVLELACRQHSEWLRGGLPPISIAVNLSPRQFQRSDLAARIEHILRKNGMEPRYLELELTESGMMADTEISGETLRRLNAIGVTVTIDDFGTGYSSLGYLKRFPIRILKIDRSFIAEITRDPDSAAIVQAIIAMAHSMNLKTVAEGVETIEQLEQLRRLDCDELQGYLFSSPLPAARLTKLLKRSQEYARTADAKSLRAVLNAAVDWAN